MEVDIYSPESASNPCGEAAFSTQNSVCLGNDCYFGVGPLRVGHVTYRPANCVVVEGMIWRKWKKGRQLARHICNGCVGKHQSRASSELKCSFLSLLGFISVKKRKGEGQITAHPICTARLFLHPPCLSPLILIHNTDATFVLCINHSPIFPFLIPISQSILCLFFFFFPPSQPSFFFHISRLLPVHHQG